MGRLTTIVISFSIIVIAVAATVLLRLFLDISVAEMVSISMATVVLLLVINTRITRSIEQRQLRSQLEDLQRVSEQFGRDVADSNARFVALDKRIEETTNRQLQPIVEELEVLGSLVGQLSDAAAETEQRLSGLPSSGMPSTASAPASEPARPDQPDEPDTNPLADEIVDEDDQDSASTAGNTPAQSDEILAAIRAEDVDVFLQPVVSLPQRRPKLYEAFARIRTEQNDIIEAEQFLDIVTDAGLAGRLDNQTIFQAVRILRQLQTRNRDIALMCNLAEASFGDEKFFTEFFAFMQANRALAENLHFEFRQAHVAGMKAADYGRLAQLKDLGYRFAIDHVTRLNFDFAELAERGFRYIKIPAAEMLNEANGDDSDIHIADLSDLAARHGISLIVEQIEQESQVVDLLDMDVRFGQGHLFSDPKPVRAEVFAASPAASSISQTA